MVPLKATHGWGPQNQRASLCLTFDNFGEACEIEIGWWGDKPIGQHITADFIPQLVDALGSAKATYFVEAINVDIYPDALKRWVAAGHEIGLHGWRHEFWTKTESSKRRDIIARSISAMRSIGVAPEGIRPPGGTMPEDAWAEIKDAGLAYVSDLGQGGVRLHGDLISLPFAWEAVDAFYFEEVAGPLRKEHGLDEAIYPPSHWAAVLDDLAKNIVREGKQATVIFHPQLLATDPERMAVFSNFVGRITADPDIWVANGAQTARFAKAPHATEPVVAVAAE